MEIIENNTFTTSVMPSFTFIVDGPETSKHNQESKLNQSQMDQQKTFQLNNNKPIPPGPLHIITSWQPSHPKEKPPYSYATLISHAILSSDYRRLTLSEIYKWITVQYPFYTLQDHGWQNSIRHNLSLNKGFIRIQRSSMNQTSRGNHWTIRSGYEQSFIDNLIKRRPTNKTIPRSQQKRRTSLSSLPSTINDNNDNESISSISTNTFSGNNSPLFTTFKMTTPSLSTNHETKKKLTKRKKSMPELHHHPIYHHHLIQDPKQRRRSIAIPKIEEEELDSDCDSGIDVRQDFLLSHIKKSKSISSFNNNPFYYNEIIDSSFNEPSLSTPLLQHQNKLINTTTSTPLLQYANLNINDDLSSNWYNNNNNNLMNYSTSLMNQDQLPLHPQSSFFTTNNNIQPNGYLYQDNDLNDFFLL